MNDQDLSGVMRTGQNWSGQVAAGHDRQKQANIGHDILGWVRMCQEGNRAGQGESGPGNRNRCLGLPCEHITFFSHPILGHHRNSF